MFLGVLVVGGRLGFNGIFFLPKVLRNLVVIECGGENWVCHIGMEISFFGEG